MCWAEPIAYGPLNLLPDVFDNLQPHEFVALCDGYNWRKESHENTMAYFVCRLMNLEGKQLKEPITVAELVKPLRESENPEEKKKSDEQYLKETFKGML